MKSSLVMHSNQATFATSIFTIPCRVKKYFLLALFLGVLYKMPTASAQITTDGYVSLSSGATQLTVGQGDELSVPLTCTGGSPFVTFYSSSTPNTAGAALGSYSEDSSTGYVWTPEASGEYYISAYLTLNGATSCSGFSVSESTTPITVLVSVADQ